jgi:EAL domain-containing protein (putative c-di-GMP-specific phosphodiesterase class I)
MRRIPGLDVLKVDRAFVAGLDAGGRAGGLVEVILGMADALGMRAVAEGVESADQVAALRDLKCWAAQGYYISKPLPADEIGELLASGAPGAHRSFS